MFPWASTLLVAFLLASGDAAYLRAGATGTRQQLAAVVTNGRAADVTPGLHERQIVDGSELCRVEDQGSGMAMRVWLAPVSEFRGKEVNLRILQFNPPNSTERAPTSAQSEIRCLGLPSPSCLAGACGACPCTRDSREMLAPSMRLVFQQLEPEICRTRDARQQRRVLLLGLGGGELAQQMATECPNVHIDAVEIDPHVIDLAQRYLGLQAGLGLTITQGSALSEVRRLALGNTTYDAVVIDCFSGEGHVPAECRSPELLGFVLKILKPGGIALQSMWHYTPHDAETVAQDFVDTRKAYAQVFGTEPTVLPVDMPIDIRWVDILRVRRPGSFDMGGLRRFGGNSTS